MEIFLNNFKEEGDAFSEINVINILKDVIQVSSLANTIAGNFQIGISIVSSEEIQKLNLEYRGKDQPTNVLSFGTNSHLKDNDSLLLGDIVLCKENNSFEIKQEDVTKIKKNCGKAFDLIFLDPPYGTGVGEQALLRLIQEEWISKDATIVFENDREVDLESFRTLESRKYGKTIINIL